MGSQKIGLQSSVAPRRVYCCISAPFLTQASHPAQPQHPLQLLLSQSFTFKARTPVTWNTLAFAKTSSIRFSSRRLLFPQKLLSSLALFHDQWWFITVSANLYEFRRIIYYTVFYLSICSLHFILQQTFQGVLLFSSPVYAMMVYTSFNVPDQINGQTQALCAVRQYYRIYVDYIQ